MINDDKMIVEDLNVPIPCETVPQKSAVDEEEFFERDLFEDILEMKSLRKVSEVTTVELTKLQNQVYQCLFELYQKNRGVNLSDNNEVFGIFEIFFKNFYQHFRTAMEGLITNSSPVKVAYFLGKSSDKMLMLLDQVVREIEKELA